MSVLPLILGSLVFGLAQGGAIALLGAGVVVIHRGSRVVNLAHGAIGMMATYVFASVLGAGQGSALRTALAAVIGIAAGAGIGVLVQWLSMRRLAARPATVRMTASLGVLYILISLAQLFFGSSTRSVTSLFGSGGHRIGVVTLTNGIIGTGVVAALIAVGLAVFYQRTRSGMVIRAVADSRSTASLGGIRVDIVGAASWALGGGLAAIAGILLAPSVGLNSFILTLLVIQALAAALTGRMQHLLPTLLGGLGIGVLTALVRGVLDATTAASPPSFINVTNIQDGIALLWALVAIAFWKREGARSVGAERGTGEPLRIPVDPRVRPVLVLLALALATFVPPWLSSSQLYLVSIGAAEAVAILSLVVVTGMAGQFSLTQAGFMGIGAFAAAHAVGDAHMPFWLSLLIGGAVAVPVGAVVGLMTLRVGGALMAVLTLAISEAISGLFLTAPFNGGGLGSMQLQRPAWLANPIIYCWFCLGVLAVLIAFVCSLRMRRAGRVFVAVKESERAAQAVGISITRTRIIAFSLSAFIAGIGGVLYAGIGQVASARDFGPFDSIALVAAGVVGGLGSTAGAVIGGLLKALGPSAVSSLPVLNHVSDPGDVAGALLGVLLLVQVTLAPAGLSRPLLRAERRLAERVRRALPLHGHAEAAG